MNIQKEGKPNTLWEGGCTAPPHPLDLLFPCLPVLLPVHHPAIKYSCDAEVTELLCCLQPTCWWWWSFNYGLE